MWQWCLQSTPESIILAGCFKILDANVAMGICSCNGWGQVSGGCGCEFDPAFQALLAHLMAMQVFCRGREVSWPTTEYQPSLVQVGISTHWNRSSHTLSCTNFLSIHVFPLLFCLLVSRWCWCGPVGTLSRLFTSSWIRPRYSSPSVDFCRFLWTWLSCCRFTCTAPTLRSPHPTPYTLPAPRLCEMCSRVDCRPVALESQPCTSFSTSKYFCIAELKQKWEENWKSGCASSSGGSIWNNLFSLFSDFAVQNCFLVGGGHYFCICTYEPYQFTYVCILITRARCFVYNAI